MNKLLRSNTLVRENLVAVIGVCLCLYFTYHAVQGGRSFISLAGLNAQIETTTKEREALLAERTALETKVAMMRPGSLSKDMLEERARAVLGYVEPDEIVVIPQ